MILHIVRDDKFIDIAFRIFEDVQPGNNEFVILSNKYPLRYISDTPIKFIGRLGYLKRGFIDSLDTYDMVVIHWLDDKKIQIINKASCHVKFVWIGWGGDYYDLIRKDIRSLFKKKTILMYEKEQYSKSSSNLKIKSKFDQLIKRILWINTTKIKSINRVNYLAPVIYEDYKLLASSIPDFSPKYLNWNYGTLEDDFILSNNDSIFGNNILLGNSSTYENNHLDMFSYLSDLDLGTRKVICPLNYGDVKYRDSVIKEGSLQFPQNFSPITDFLANEEYIKLLSSCSVAIMGHLRQQAVGNIIIMLYMGAKIFLDRMNPVYKFLKKENAIIFALDQIRDEIDGSLEKIEIETNRTVLKRHWSRTVIRKKTLNLVNSVLCGR